MTRSTRVGRCSWKLQFMLALSCGLLIARPDAFAQIVTATLQGTVTDQAGASVPGASVTATNAETGIPNKTTSDDTGSYIFPRLNPGDYNLVVEKEGFKAARITGIKLLVAQQARVDAQLQVGELTTTVEIRGAAPLVETTTASVGTVIGTQQVVELPLNERRFGSFALLVPGTTADNGGFASSVYGSTFSETTYGANGARTSSNNILIDGADSRNLYLGGFSIQPSPDAVQEFNIQTSIYSAAFGKTAGSTINLVTKSGTNDFHGTVYEFLRNDKIDARSFFSSNQNDPVTGRELPGTARPEFRRNQFGFSLGGPIRKNKTFFFGNYEGLREIKGLSPTSVVPTDTEKRGDFGSLLTGQMTNLCSPDPTKGGAAPSQFNFDKGQLFSPGSLTFATCPAQTQLAGTSILVGTPIAGNTITNIDPVAQKVVAAWPEPNHPGAANFIFTEPRRRADSQFDIRIDHTINSNNQLFGRYLFGQTHITDPTFGFTPLPGFGDLIYFRGQNAALSWTHTFGPHLLNEFRIGFDRNWNPVSCLKCPRPSGFMESFGIQNLKASSPSVEGFPFFGFSNFAGVGDSGYTPNIGPHMLEKYQDNLTWTRGRHTIVVGADLQWWQSLHFESPVSPHGQFSYDGRFSSLGGAIPGVSGVADLADFLQGYPSSALRSFTSLILYHTGGTFSNFYGQDDIKVNPNLTLNVGLRYEYRRQPVEKRDHLASFFPTGAKFSGPGNALLVTSAPDALNDSFCTDPFSSYLVTSDGRCLVATSAERAKLGFTGRTRRTLVFPDRTNFAPRLGLTWRPLSSDRLIIRTGSGIFYDLGNFNNYQFVENNPVFEPSQIYNTAFASPPPLTNGVPTTVEKVFAGGSSQFPPLISQFISVYVSPNWRAPSVYEWSFGIESQLAQNIALEVDYIGSHSIHEGNLHLFANQPEPGLGDLQPRRPYPDFNQILYSSPDASANYNSLQAKLTKRFANGFTALVSYTWAHSIDNNEGDEGFSGGVGNSAPQDDNNLPADRARAFTDARQRLVFSYIWQLPFGDGKRFFNRRGVVNQVAGGWQITGITTYQSGFPFSVLAGQDFSNTGTLNMRPDRLCDGSGKKTIGQWFNTSCFTNQALENALAAGAPRFGNSGRNILTGPAYHNWDLALLKNFQMGERFKLQFRAEFFNAFNLVAFSPPNSVVSNTALLGQITGAGSGRDIQFGLKVSF